MDVKKYIVTFEHKLLDSVTYVQDNATILLPFYNGGDTPEGVVRFKIKSLLDTDISLLSLSNCYFNETMTSKYSLELTHGEMAILRLYKEKRIITGPAKPTMRSVYVYKKLDKKKLLTGSLSTEEAAHVGAFLSALLNDSYVLISAGDKPALAKFPLNLARFKPPIWISEFEDIIQ